MNWQVGDGQENLEVQDGEEHTRLPMPSVKHQQQACIPLWSSMQNPVCHPSIRKNQEEVLRPVSTDQYPVIGNLIETTKVSTSLIHVGLQLCVPH
jgi:hypothetical protein